MDKRTWTGLQGIEAKLRNCFFYDEFRLKMHDNYTQANCKLECAIKYAQNMTGKNTAD